MNEHTLTSWLMENAGPIIRFRTATELISSISDNTHKKLEKELLECDEVQKWLGKLVTSTHIHSSKDTAAENSLAKLIAYGVTARIPIVRNYLDQIYTTTITSKAHGNAWDARILFPFFLAAGYTDELKIAEFVESEIETMHSFAHTSLHEFQSRDDIEELFFSPSEKACENIPKMWRDKYIWALTLEDVLPCCYDYYLLSYASDYKKQQTTLLEFVTTKRFQRFCECRELHGSYIWNREKRRCYSSAEMPYLFGFSGFDKTPFVPNKFLLYLELTSQFPNAASITWFRSGMEYLEQYRTNFGSYVFPAEYLPERKNGYYLYRGAHMRLGERGKQAREIESTFRMLSMKKKSGLL